VSTEQLERSLRALAADVEWPATRDLTAEVAGSITSRNTRRPAWAPRLRPVLVGAAVVVTVAVATLVASPGARSAVASWFGLGGVAVERTTEGPSSTPSPATQELNLGTPTTLQAGQAAVDFPVRGLDLQGGAVYLDRSVPGGMVSFVYPPQRGLPPTTTQQVGAILSIFPGDADDPFFTKEVMQGQDVEFVPLGGDDFAMWVSGPSHLLLRNEDGRAVRHTARLAANALVWVAADGVAYRLETALSLQAALRLSESLR
jgi:hypothetical protein